SARELAAAVQAERSGEYDRAIDAYEDALEALEDAEDREAAARAWRGRVRTLSLVGRYEEAEEVAREGLTALGGVGLWNVLGEVLEKQGRLEEAADAYRNGAEGQAVDRLDARLNLAALDFRRGARGAALEAFDSFIDVYNRNRNLTARELTAVATAVRYLGRTDPDLFQDALRAYDEAVEADPDLLEPRILTGELFLEKYQSGEARTTFQEVLGRNPRHPDALLGMARALNFDNDPNAVPTARQALETNPRHAPTHAFLARVFVELERYDEAEAAAREALAINPTSLEGLSVLAATHHLADEARAFDEVQARTDSLYPQNSTLPLTVAEISATHRRYEEAVDFASLAVRRDSRNWQAMGILGLNQLRIGDVAIGRRNVERAFEGDPYNPWFKNTLDLLDTWGEYETLSTEHFDIVIHQDEVDVLGPYVARLAEDAYDALTLQYQHEPPTPIRLEVYPSHADFSVRTVGLTGLGALGVSFGKVVVLDSPTARDPASFNWASALWHEIAHSVHMSLSRQRVPRWFSEGLAVEDQRRARDGWGHGASIAFLQAFNAGRLPPASRLNDGFMRPEFPGQVVLSYFQASLLFDFMEEEWGFDAVRRMLRGYAGGATTEELLPRILDLDEGELDERFESYVRERYAGALEAVTMDDEARPPAPPDEGILTERVSADPEDFGARMQLAAILRSEGDLEGAAEHLTAALRLFPDYAGNDSPHWGLAQIRHEQGRPEEAVRHLATLRSINESHLPGAMLEAEIRRELGQLEGAAEALERAIEIAPFEMEVHRRLAVVYGDLGRWNDAVREREAIVGLAPVDMSTAWYEVARARLNADDLQGARQAVLRALERAPRFQEALELLLEIRGQTPQVIDSTGGDGVTTGPGTRQGGDGGNGRVPD
ncbi:MAG: tetratricopeptide repeat protein, partial [Longimicrobiales bacterium]|nr:tetratricopeptide repeat protein [Longimicrobiales bacterium]